MSKMISRRRFGQLVLTSATATAALGQLAVNAAESSIVYGADIVSDSLVLKSIDLTSGATQDMSSLASGLKLSSTERLTSLSAYSSTEFVLSTTYVSGTTIFNRIYTVVAGKSPKILTVSGLDSKSTVESMAFDKNKKLIGLIGQKIGIPPYALATFDKKTALATIMTDFRLPPDWAFGNLTQHSNGLIYATCLQRESSTRLVQIDVKKRQLILLEALNVGGNGLNSNLGSLAYSKKSSKLYALGNPTSQEVDSVFSTNVSTGEMKMLKSFAVSEIAAL